MKKIAFLLLSVVCTTFFFACNNKKEKEAASEFSATDSLQQIVAQKDKEMADMVTTMNDIQEGFRKINEAQGRITIERKQGEQSNRAHIVEDVKLIENTIRLNNDLINNLRQQVKASKSNNTELRKKMEESVAAFTAQIADLTKQAEDLRAELAKKDIKIAELGEQNANLQSNVNELSAQNETKARTVASQDRELNSAYYVFGTKSELKEQNILKGGEVLRSNNFNKDYFTKIDIRVDKVIRLYSKSARLMTTHPEGSYSLDKDAQGQYTLRITDPTRFWSVSKYLVITVK